MLAHQNLPRHVPCRVSQIGRNLPRSAWQIAPDAGPSDANWTIRISLANAPRTRDDRSSCSERGDTPYDSDQAHDESDGAGSVSPHRIDTAHPVLVARYRCARNDVVSLDG